MPKNKKCINLKWLMWQLFPEKADRKRGVDRLKESKEKGEISDHIYDMLMTCLTEDNSREKKWAEVCVNE